MLFSILGRTSLVCRRFVFLRRPRLGMIQLVNETHNRGCEIKGAGDDDDIVEDGRKHDVSPFRVSFSMIPLYAFIGVLYIDKMAENARYRLCNIYICAILILICICLTHIDIGGTGLSVKDILFLAAKEKIKRRRFF